MSFFGFDPTRGPNPDATGFSQAHDPFAGLSEVGNVGDAIEFEDTYDGLGDQLDETNDAFNDDTFGGAGSGGLIGGSASSPAPVGKDFDFFGQTAKVANAFEEEQLQFVRQQATASRQPAASATSGAGSAQYQIPACSYKPARTGYEKYQNEPIKDLQVDAALWGVAPKKQASPASSPTPQAAPAPARKILSLEEVEAQMRAQANKSVQPQHPAIFPQSPLQMQHSFDGGSQYNQQEIPHSSARVIDGDHHGHGHPVAILQRPQSKIAPSTSSSVPLRPQPVPPVQPTLQPQPVQILQNPNRLPNDAHRSKLASQQPIPAQSIYPLAHFDPRQQPFGRHPVITHPAQLAQFPEEQKAAYLEQEAKRAKRNHKIFLMSRDNGLMTPQDKNFVTRIQLQQLVSAAGNLNEHGTDESLVEDFYYQVHHSIQTGQHQHPSQPPNNFAKTYLFQTGSRLGGMRRHTRGPENHMQRMEQQVQRAVEAAKNKPKNKQLVIEGSLGKISFSNAKTPKPLLNIKRTESLGEAQRTGRANKAPSAVNGRDRKRELLSLEMIYGTLMIMEDHDRNMPLPTTSDSDSNAIQAFEAWRKETDRLNNKLWAALRIHDKPATADTIHPFIALLSYAKGKKAMHRVFRYLTHQQRMTILTLVTVNLDSLDVVVGAQIHDGEARLNVAMRENIELFQLVVQSTLFNVLNELDLGFVSGVLGIVCSRNVDVIAKSRVGAAMLTMILSCPEMIKQNSGGNEQAWRTWELVFNQFFNLIEPSLFCIFPGPVNSGEDVYVWQLLAAIGISASPEQQQRLVLAVKDRVMDTIHLSKTLPPEMATQRLQSVNLFMRSIGLDVELLQ